MEQELAELRRQLEQEQRLRRAAEADAERSQPKTFIEYLEACHKLSLTVEIITDKASTTQGNTTDPTDRQHPLRIVPWGNFLPEQEEVWELFSTNPDFHSKRIFPSSHQLDYVRKNLHSISAETGLRHYARETVENHVWGLVEEIHKDEQLREVLGLRGKVVFESHTNIGEPSGTPIEEEMKQMSITRPTTPNQMMGAAQGKGQKADKGKGKAKQDISRSRSRTKGGPADQFCIYEQLGGEKTPIMSIEYKAPHKFSLDNVVAGLDGEIRPLEDVINKEGESFEFNSKWLAAAVITQLFSDMIRKGVRWGYVFTGEAIIFLHIADDPSIVYYHLSIPKLDYREDDENRLYLTAVAEVFAFVVRAARAEMPSQSWHDEAEKLPIWPVERVNILQQISPTPENKKKKVRHSTYRSKRKNGFLRSPIVLRSRGKVTTCNDKDVSGDDDRHDEGDDFTPDSPTPRQGNSRHVAGSQAATAKEPRASRRTKKSKAGSKKPAEPISRPRIEERRYCTQRCLLGLAYGGAMDKQCPNFQDHNGKHINQRTFLRLIKQQLATDRGSNADCKPLYIKGARGALFKVRLSSHGYTLVAKGMVKPNLGHLQHEQRIYDHVRPIQGKFVPVCLGSVMLELPYYYDGGIYVSMLFLSWAGRPLFDFLTGENEGYFADKSATALQALHDLQVLQKDPEPRNILWDEHSQCLRFVDFERAEIRARQPLGVITPNRKRKRREWKQNVGDDFSLEIQRAKQCISRWLRPSRLSCALMSTRY